MPSPVSVFKWKKYIIEQLGMDNSFLMRARNDNEDLVGTRVIIPQAGDAPETKENNSTYPLSPLLREDSVVEYDMTTFDIVPVQLPPGEAETVTYNKMASIVKGIVDAAQQDIATKALYEWAPSLATVPAAVLATSGDDIPADDSYGMTGTRKAISKADIVKARKALNKAGYNGDGRVLVIPAEMESDIMNIDGFIDLTKITAAEMRRGFIGKILGFDVYVRPFVIITNETGEKKYVSRSAYKATPALIAAKDCHAALFFVDEAVRYAYGTAKNGGVHVSINSDQSMYAGSDLIGGYYRGGGSPTRHNHTGIVLLYQATS